MTPDNPSSKQADADLPLPGSNSSSGNTKNEPEKNVAADFIRKKVEAAYTDEPSVEEEIDDIATSGPAPARSKHQQFIFDLTNSGKSLAEIQAAWHEYYAGLPDTDRHQVWQEFYLSHAQASHFMSAVPSMQPGAQGPAKAKALPLMMPQAPRSLTNGMKKVRNLAVEEGKLKPRPKPSPLHSLAFGLGIGSIVLFIFLFSFFNERFIAPFIQPSRTATNTPIISDSSVGSGAEVVIPKINVEIPVVYGVSTVQEVDVDNALENGVVHYADTAVPGQNGNVVIVGHSSNNIFNKGKYKFAFVLLSRLENGDTFYLQKDGKRYTYQVYKKQIVKPTDVGVLGAADKQATATLITCDPPGTSTNRLVVTGEQISPNPVANAPSSTNQETAQTAIIPGNAPSLWSRLFKIFLH